VQSTSDCVNVDHQPLVYRLGQCVHLCEPSLPAVAVLRRATHRTPVRRTTAFTRYLHGSHTRRLLCLAPFRRLAIYILQIHAALVCLHSVSVECMGNCCRRPIHCFAH